MKEEEELYKSGHFIMHVFCKRTTRVVVSSLAGWRRIVFHRESFIEIDSLESKEEEEKKRNEIENLLKIQRAEFLQLDCAAN